LPDRSICTSSGGGTCAGSSSNTHSGSSSSPRLDDGSPAPSRSSRSLDVANGAGLWQLWLARSLVSDAPPFGTTNAPTADTRSGASRIRGNLLSVSTPARPPRTGGVECKLTRCRVPKAQVFGLNSRREAPIEPCLGSIRLARRQLEHGPNRCCPYRFEVSVLAGWVVAGGALVWISGGSIGAEPATPSSMLSTRSPPMK
jgi:hypothetical protein